MDVYTYQPFYGPRNFRILELFPGEKHDELRCQLFEHSIDHPPQYEAISYAWGEPTFSHSIWIDGQRCWITESLAKAFRRLRLPNTGRRLWADAICINQNHVQERNGQVLLMRQIYANAIRVLVHLGERADYSELVPELCQKVDRAIKLHAESAAYTEEGILLYDYLQEPASLWSRLKSYLLPKLHSLLWQSFFFLMLRP
jgi:Heterokaryon incompatibility protein (HET)